MVLRSYDIVPLQVDIKLIGSLHVVHYYKRKTEKICKFEHCICLALVLSFKTVPCLIKNW